MNVHQRNGKRNHLKQKGGKIAVNINELPPDLKRKMGKKAGIQREQILKVAASVIKSCTESGEPLVVQRKALELALKWLKIR